MKKGYIIGSLIGGSLGAGLAALLFSSNPSSTVTLPEHVALTEFPNYGARMTELLPVQVKIENKWITVKEIWGDSAVDNDGDEKIDYIVKGDDLLVRDNVSNRALFYREDDKLALLKRKVQGRTPNYVSADGTKKWKVHNE